jgi:hypothetical protein
VEGSHLSESLRTDAQYEASEGEVFPLRTLHDLLFNFSLNCLSLLQQQDGPKLEHDELSFSYLPVAPVVLFCKNASPCRRSYWTASLIVQNQLSNGNEFPKLLPPRAQVKARRVTTRRIQKELYHLLWTKRLRTLTRSRFAL